MPRFRPDLEGLVTYVPGRPIEEVAREIGMDPAAIIKLASNESPEGPFPGVREAVQEAALDSNRYPDSDVHDLTRELSTELGVANDEIWFGAGSTGLLGSIALSVGGAGTTAVYACPSFIMYRIISRWAGAQAIEVSLDHEHRHDLDAIAEAITPDTSVVYICNPNNPTGTIVDDDSLDSFVAGVPDSVLVVVDEAYHHFVDDPRYRSFLDRAPSRSNVVVLRTFSKIFGLASHRIGFAVGNSDVLAGLRRTQAPFTVTSVAQAAAMASLGQATEIERRRLANSAGRHHLTGALDERGIARTDSQANFVFFELGDGSNAVPDAFTRLGVIVRPMSKGWLRVTIGTPAENERFVGALDEVLATIS